MLLREGKLPEIADELNEERAARGSNVAPSAQATAAARTATAAAADAERTRASKAEKAAARKLEQEQDNAAKKVVADAKKGGGGGGGAGQVGRNAAGSKFASQPCYDFVRDGSCRRGDADKFSQDLAACNAAPAVPAASAAVWQQKWDDRVNPKRGGDLAAKVHGPLRGMAPTNPWDFNRFLRCQFWRIPVRSGFERIFAHERVEAAADGHGFLKPEKNEIDLQNGSQVFRKTVSPGHRRARGVHLHLLQKRDHTNTCKFVFEGSQRSRRRTGAPPVEVACASGSRKSPQNRCKSTNYSQIEGSRYPLQLRWRPLAADEADAAASGAAGMPVLWPRRPAAVSEAATAGAGPDFSCAGELEQPLKALIGEVRSLSVVCVCVSGSVGRVWSCGRSSFVIPSSWWSGAAPLRLVGACPRFSLRRKKTLSALLSCQAANLGSCSCACWHAFSIKHPLVRHVPLSSSSSPWLARDLHSVVACTHTFG